MDTPSPAHDASLNENQGPIFQKDFLDRQPYDRSSPSHWESLRLLVTGFPLAHVDPEPRDMGHVGDGNPGLLSPSFVPSREHVQGRLYTF